MQWMIRAAVLAVTLSGFCLASAEAQRREHAAHQHGHASGTLAEDSGQWQLRMELPGHNLVGFEHAPDKDEQRHRLNHVRETLESARWIRPDPQSDCRVGSVDVEATGYGAAHEHGHDAHSDGHEHDDADHAAEASDDTGHAAFHLAAVIACNSGRRMRWLDIDLFSGFPDNRSIRIDVLSDGGAASNDLDKEDFRIRFD